MAFWQECRNLKNTIIIKRVKELSERYSVFRNGKEVDVEDL